MKPTKSKTKIKSDNQSSSTIQKFFKAAPKESNERASPNVASNVKSFYVNALLEKLNRCNEKTDSSNENNSEPNATADPNPTADLNPTADPNPTTDHVKVNKSNRCEACGRSDKSNGCGDCDQWRSKYEEQKKIRIKLSLKYTDLMLKYDELVQVAKGMVRPNKSSEKVLNEASQAIFDFDEPSQAIHDSDGASQAMSAFDGASQAMSALDGASQAMPASNGASRDLSASDKASRALSASDKASQAMSTSDRGSQPVSMVSEIFTDNEIKCLQCIPLDKKKDSTFVMHCVEYAYKNNAASLVNKTLKGTRARYETDECGDVVIVKPGKGAMTPEKVTRIQQLFNDRVTKSKCMAGEFGDRVNVTNFNRLIASAIKNVSNKEAPKSVLSNPNANLNL